MNNFYTKYMQTQTWKLKRERALIRSNFKCELCGFDASEVHHLTYERLGDESVDDLQALCFKCHWEAHQLPKIGKGESLPAYLERMKGTEHDKMLGNFMNRMLSAKENDTQVLRVFA